MKEQWEKNYVANKETIKKTTPFCPVIAKATDFVPSLVVGAGPSLAKNIDQIRPELYDLVLCDKVTPRLAEKGIFPRYIVALNGAKTDVTEWLAPAMNKSMLVMPCAVHPDTYKGWDLDKIRFINNVTATGIHERIEKELGLIPMVIGSNAGTFAYIVAAQTLHNPIGYCGMDFSFKTRREVLDRQDVRQYNIWEIRINEKVDVAYANIGWFDMAEAFQEHVKSYAEWFGIETYNVTEGGINYSEYVAPMELKEWNKKLGEVKDEKKENWLAL